jgi:hypothetical protein
MPFKVKGDEALTVRVSVRVTPGEKERLEDDAGKAGLSVSELIRRRYFGRPIMASADATVVAELRRLGGLLKHVHNESNGAYSRQTSEALSALTRYIERLAR